MVALAIGAGVCLAQDDYDEAYNNQGGNGNQADADNYNGGYGNDDGYAGNMPNYQQNLDSDGSNNSPSSYSGQAGSDVDGDYEADDGSAAAAASNVKPTVLRVRRSVAEAQELAPGGKLRVKRHGKYYIGPVYTYVKTDKHANFKWGVSSFESPSSLPNLGRQLARDSLTNPI